MGPQTLGLPVGCRCSVRLRKKMCLAAGTCGHVDEGERRVAAPCTGGGEEGWVKALRRQFRRFGQEVINAAVLSTLTDARCGGDGSHGCGRNIDVHGDHRAACPCTGALARRAHVVEHAWVRVSREAVSAEGRVIPQQWLVHTNAEGVRADDRLRLDFVIHGATPSGQVLCCDATLVSPSK